MSTINITYKAHADNHKTGMTLDELARFVQTCMTLDIAGNTPVKITAGWSQQIKTITATDLTQTIEDHLR